MTSTTLSGQHAAAQLDPRAISPIIKIFADALPVLIEIERVAIIGGYYAEEKITAGLIDMLATLVEGETTPESDEHRLAHAALYGDEDAEGGAK
jgi:hypothetical protein